MKESLVLVLSVILLLIVFGIVCLQCGKRTENFSPMGTTQNCPEAKPTALSPRIAYGNKFGWKNIDGQIVGSYSPGSVFKCNNQKDCANITVNGCPKKEDIPTVRENLPLGWGSTMTGPYAENYAMSNINNVNRASMKNPYGKVFPDGDQMYGFFEKGAENYFSS